MTDEIKNGEVKEIEKNESNEQAHGASSDQSEAPSTSNEQVVENQQPEEPKSDRQGGFKEKVVPLREIVKERQRRRDLEKKIEELERKISSKETPSKVRELMEDLDLDESTAAKLAKHITPPQDEIKTLEESFRRQAEDISGDYPDWFELQQEMAEELNAIYSKDPKRALSQSPEIYYLKAKARLSKGVDQARQEGARDAANKINSKNLAVTESAKNGTVKAENNKPKKFTRAWLKTLSQEDFVKYHNEINAELARGGFKE